MPTTSTRMANLSDQELRDLAEKAHTMPNDLTPEQRALIHLDARMEARHTLRKYRNSAIVGFLILAIGMGASQVANNHAAADGRARIVDSGNAVAVTGCNRDFNTSLRQRQALYRQPDRSNGQPLTPEQRDQIIRQLTPLPDCRQARNVVTDTKERRVPKALHEGLVGEQGELRAGG